jgi:two-component system nitrogen regulation response regulator GlnG
MSKLLIVDDEPSVVFSIEKCLRPLAQTIQTANNGADAIRRVESERPDVVILDVCLPDMSGLQVYQAIRRFEPKLPVIIITAFATTETAIEAMKGGALEYLVKPVDFQQLRDVVGRAIEISQLNAAGNWPSRMPAGDASGDELVGQSPAMQQVYKAIGRVSSQDVTALILGESGTGKEMVAKAIWRHSNRADKPFVAINCAAIPETLLESELFGFEKGAFTGANERRVGKFEQADGGTIFLDEIGDMSPATQAKVLRVIQERSFERIGGTQSVSTDVRILAATNKNLVQMAAEGTFRQDLFYRINGFTISLPPLRERKGDIGVLANHFIQHLNHQLGKTVRGVSAEAMQWLEQHEWPGNVRELQNIIKHAMIKSVGDVLLLESFPTEMSLPLPASNAAPADARDKFPRLAALARQLIEEVPGDVYRKLTSAVDSIVIDVALKHTKGNQLHAALLLGISRTTLRAKLRSLGFTVEKQLSVEEENT